MQMKSKNLLPIGYPSDPEKSKKLSQYNSENLFFMNTVKIQQNCTGFSSGIEIFQIGRFPKSAHCNLSTDNNSDEFLVSFSGFDATSAF